MYTFNATRGSIYALKLADMVRFVRCQSCRIRRTI